MHDPILEDAERSSLQAGLTLSTVSVIWTALASTAAIAIGVRSESLVLVAFGLTGILDAAGSTALVLHFRHSIHHEQFSQEREDLAFKIVTVGLVGVACFTLVESMRRLTTEAHGHTAVGGIVLAAVSAAVLGVLAHKKRKIARRIPSQALMADAVLSATGALLAIITVVGAGLSSIGFWWADPVAAASVACIALVLSVQLHRHR